MTTIDRPGAISAKPEALGDSKLGNAVLEGLKFAALMFCLSIPILLTRIERGGQCEL